MADHVLGIVRYGVCITNEQGGKEGGGREEGDEKGFVYMSRLLGRGATS